MADTANEFKDLPEVYCRAWASRNPSDLLDLFADDSVMTDHGAQLHVPRNFLERHHKHWNGAHENFEVYLEYVHGLPAPNTAPGKEKPAPHRGPSSLE